MKGNKEPAGLVPSSRCDAHLIFSFTCLTPACPTSSTYTTCCHRFNSLLPTHRPPSPLAAHRISVPRRLDLHYTLCDITSTPPIHNPLLRPCTKRSKCSITPHTRRRTSSLSSNPPRNSSTSPHLHSTINLRLSLNMRNPRPRSNIPARR